MTFKKAQTAFRILSCAGLLSLLLTSCDKMIPNPDLLESTNVTIEFSSDPAQVTLGGSAALSWSVNDPDGVVKTVNISGGGLGQVVSLSDSMSVSPKASTVYYLNILNAENDVIKSGQTSIKVVDENNQEITTAGAAASETVCDDGEDDEGDGLVDCADDDCDDDGACSDAAPATGSFTTAPSFTFDGSVLCPGETVTVTWASDFEFVSLSYDDGVSTDSQTFSGTDAEAGSYEFVIGDSAAEITFVGTKNSVANEAVVLEVSPDVTADECSEKKFEGQFQATVFPSKRLIEGEPYVLGWSTANVSSVTLDGEAVEVEQDVNDADAEVRTAGTKEKHVFDLLDTQDDPFAEQRTVTLNVSNFELAEKSELASGVSKVMSGASSDEFYIYSGTQVIKATDSFAKLETLVDTSTLTVSALCDSAAEQSQLQSQVLAYGKTSGGQVYVATNSYLFAVSGTDAKCLFVKSSGQFNFILGVNDAVVVGDDSYLKRWESGDACAADSHKYQSAYCCTLIGPGGADIKDCYEMDYSESQVNYRGYFKNGADAVFLVANDGVYKSTNDGASFSSISTLTDIVGGSTQGAEQYVWSENALYKYESDTDGFSDVELDSDITAIRYAASQAGRLFVATDSGLYIKNAKGWSGVVLDKKVDHIVFGAQLAKGFKVKKTSSGISIEKTGEVQKTTYSATVLTNGGSQGSVSFGRDLIFNAR